MAIVTRTLGGTGAEVTILGYGAMELRGRPRGPEIADQDAGRLLNAVLDGGINLIDTSPDYGRSEELIGTHIGHRRDEFFLASKCGCPLVVPADALPPYPHDYSPGNVRADVEQSLRRLRTDRLDLVQVHMSPAKARLEENDTVETLKGLQAEGKVRFIGMSGILPNLPDHIAMGVFDVFQIPYSAVQRDHEELITEAAGAGAGTFIRGGAARGASRSATPACRPRSSALRTRSTWPATSPSRRGDHSLPTSTKKPRSASRSRTPANQKPAASALRDSCRSRVDGGCDAADKPDRTLTAGLPHMPMSARHFSI